MADEDPLTLNRQKNSECLEKSDDIDPEDKLMLQNSMTVQIEFKGSPLDLQYGLLSHPPVLITVMAALQHILLCLSSALATSQVVADSACAPYDHPIRSQLFCTTLCMVGICTFLQTAFGVRFESIFSSHTDKKHHRNLHPHHVENLSRI
ncbi:hypothetical protein EGW08_007192 [Elysia chlorotica]|uniref:Uncharacterized protein n=1 Tax=Elysia chlorotica TaxID=188477 RepID=A0A3S1C7J2_ELYCH|nr:hypothetical protein EGW08_007192 [Elysia chlorotica]